jgi:hypothetical protein
MPVHIYFHQTASPFLIFDASAAWLPFAFSDMAIPANSTLDEFKSDSLSAGSADGR